MIETAELSQREKEIIDVLKDYPQGITLPETAYIMHVPSLSLIQPMKNLLKKGFIKKKANKYLIFNLEK